MSRCWWLGPLFCLLLQYGCAGRQAAAPPVSEAECRSVIATFFKMRERQQHCGCCFDAEVAVTLSVTRWLGNGSATISGYLQAMAPSYLKFVGINPLGQPQVILITDGQQFQWAVVPAARVYAGPVASEAFRKYSPAGFNPEGLYFWLSGQLPAEPLTIWQIDRNEAGSGYWLRLEAQHRSVGRVLFDPDSGTVRSRILEKSDGRLLLAVSYEDYQDVNGCLRPGKITISSPAQNSGAVAVLSSFVPDAKFAAPYFRFELLPDFDQFLVR